MAFIVETGAIIADANAYIDVAFLDAYFADRNVDLSTFTNEQKQAAIVVVTQYVNLNNRWKGAIVSDAQTLPFPRKNVYDAEGRELDSATIPTQLKNAIAEYARRQLVADIQPDVDTESGAIVRKKDKIGDLESEIQYQENTTGYFGLKRYPLADKYLYDLRVGGVAGNMGRLIRGG